MHWLELKTASTCGIEDSKCWLGLKTTNAMSIRKSNSAVVGTSSGTNSCQVRIRQKERFLLGGQNLAR